MNLTLTDSARDEIANLDDEIVLAIIKTDGEIRIRVADARDYPGHREWLRRDAIEKSDVVGGFSMIIEGGLVTGLFPLSSLNQTDPPCLSGDQINAVESLLPLGPRYTVYQ